MKQGLDREKAEAALKRAAHKAIHGTREERSGRFLPNAERGAAGKAGEASGRGKVEKRKA